MIVGTVLLYALTAAPVARRLGVVKPSGTRILLVGGEPWVVDMGRSLRSAGLDVLMWAGLDEERQRIKDAGIELARGDLLATATNPGARLEGVTAVFLATDDDDFNALASVVMQDNVEGPVYRVGPPHEGHGVVAPYTGGAILFGSSLVRHALAERYEAGARFLVQPASAAGCPPTTTPSSWCGPTAGSNRSPANEPVTPQEGDSVVLLGLRPSPAVSLDGGCPSGYAPPSRARLRRRVQGDGRIDQGEVRERLREVAELSPCQVDLLGVQAQVVGVREHLLQHESGLIGSPGPCQGVDVHERAQGEGPFGAAQSVG